MPVYDFQCPEGHVFEHVCPMAAADDKIPCTTDGCTEQAQNACTIGGHDHGLGRFRDAALEGRDNEKELFGKGMLGGRNWER